MYPVQHPRGILVVLAPFLLPLATAAAQVQYRVTDLGTLGGYSAPAAINNAGTVAGQSSLPTGVAHPFVTDDFGEITDIGLPPGTNSAYATGINDGGTVVGYGVVPTIGERGFVYADGVMSTVPLASGAIGNPASGINDAGQVVGTMRYPGGVSPYVMTGGRVSVLDTPNDAPAAGQGINNSGQVVGKLSHPAQPSGRQLTTAVVWAANGAATELAPLPGYVGTDAFTINDRGHVAGAMQRYASPGNPAPVDRPFLYRDGRLTDLGPMPWLGGDVATRVWDVNESDAFVGQYLISIQAAVPTRAFLYSGGRYVDLASLVTLPDDFVMSDARAINDAGQIVVTGSKYSFATNEGTSRAFLLTPLPEPGAGACVALAGAAAVLRRRRQTG